MLDKLLLLALFGIVPVGPQTDKRQADGEERPEVLIVIRFGMVLRQKRPPHGRSTICPKDEIQKARQMIEGRAFRECLDVMQKSRTFFARTMTASLQHARHGFDAMHEAAVEKSGELSGKMFRKVEYLNIIGNLGPLMGLVGTVLGMIVAFQAMGSGGGEAGAGELAKGISLALANTLLGLSLAVVGIGSFGICRNRIDSYTVEATVESLDLLEYFRPAAAAGRSSEAKKASRTEPPKSAARPAPQPAKTS